MTNSKRVFFPLHMDSGNRGCEAIALGTKEILSLKKDEYIGLTKNIENDKQTKISEEVTLVVAPLWANLSSIGRFMYKVKRKLLFIQKHKKRLYYKFTYNQFLNDVDNVCFITGGDMLCYDDNDVIYINNKLSDNNIKTVLWGCSFGKENLTPNKNETLKRFNLITARESLTYNYLTKDLHLPNVRLFPDPAFVLNPKKNELPDYFLNDIVGINLSNFVGSSVGVDTIFGQSILSLMKYIIKNTDYHIVLIPHVFWKEQDDRITCNYFKELFGDESRIRILDTEKMSYCQIRYAISKCRFFLGARTHAMISAYSTCVPSIALGYSIKSKGIAEDLNLPEYTILDYRRLKDENEVVDRFKLLQEHEIEIKELLESEMPSYSARAYEAKAYVEELINKND